ncbi:hypothetical protein Aduo_014513 [Ancylostoma duodenale]
MRDKFVDTHNGYRSLLAQGLAFTQGGADSRKASKMRSLVYDCDAENSAYESAMKCSTTASSSEKYDENVYVIEDDGDVSDPILEAVNSWSSEALDLNQAKTGNLYSSSDKIPNFANVAWDSHTKVGCAVVKCGSKTHVVCHYTPKEEAEGRLIYEMGDPCSRCNAYGEFTCEEGLCVTKQK